MSAAKTKNSKNGARPSVSVISQWFTSETIRGLDLMVWFYNLARVGQRTDGAVSRNHVAEMAFRHFTEKFKERRPEYAFAPPEGEGTNTSLRVSTETYVAIKLIAQRERRAIEHTVETAIHEFVADVATPAMTEFHEQAVKKGRALIKVAERKRLG